MQFAWRLPEAGTATAASNAMSCPENTPSIHFLHGFLDLPFACAELLHAGLLFSYWYVLSASYPGCCTTEWVGYWEEFYLLIWARDIMVSWHVVVACKDIYKRSLLTAQCSKIRWASSECQVCESELGQLWVSGGVSEWAVGENRIMLKASSVAQ